MEHDSRPSLATVIETSEWYVESKDRGAAIELTAAAFAESEAG
jgi:hypothetical protein